MSLLGFFGVACLIILLIKSYFSKTATNTSGLPYPPGPKSLPVIGNLLDVPKSESWKTYGSWGKQYGELVHFTVFGQHYIVINSMRVAVDLLEKRSKTYSDRPEIPMLEVIGWDWNTGVMPYGAAWRQRRREIHQQFRTEKALQYHPTIMKEAHQFLNKLLLTPDKFASHIRHYPGAVIMSVVYDYEVASADDHFLNIAEEAISMLSVATFPGATLVNTFPWLQYLPSWLPGMGFKQHAERCRRLTAEMKGAPLQYVRDRIASGAPTRCVATEVLSRLSDPMGQTTPEAEEVIKDVVAIAYAAGADTTVSAITTGFLAMLLYPEAKKKAQQEIDTIVGSDRLPTLHDRASLPYVEAFVWEVLRWHPVLPLSVARAAYDNDIYEGKFIPKEATILMNTWAIHHDEGMYPEPEVFKPERFLGPDGSLKDEYPMTAFGIGRRICPGRHAADASLWVAVTLVLAAFDVRKRKDESGREIDVSDEFTDSLISHPVGFVCDIQPRNPRTESIIREAVMCRE